MKKIISGILLCSVASLTQAASTSFDFTGLYPAAQDVPSYSVTSLDGGVTATLSGSANLGALNLDGVGVYTGGLNAWGIQKNETLTVSFSQAVDIATVHLRQWELADKLQLTTNNGDNITIDNESALFDTNEYVNVNLMNVTTFSLSGDSFGTVAFLAGLNGIEYSTSEVPVPAAAWLFGSALLGLAARKK